MYRFGWYAVTILAPLRLLLVRLLLLDLLAETIAMDAAVDHAVTLDLLLEFVLSPRDPCRAILLVRVHL